MNGFTIELDGEPEAIRRLFDALASEYNALLREGHEARGGVALELGIPPRYIDRLRYHSPVKGTFTIR